MVHIPKDVPVFLDFLPTSLEDCVKLIKIYGQWLFTAEHQGKFQLASEFENILDHLRYRYIKIQNLVDPESQYIVHLYEQLMPVEFYFNANEKPDTVEIVSPVPSKAEESVQSDAPITVEPSVVTPPTEDLSTRDPVDIKIDCLAEKRRILDLAVCGQKISTDDLETVIKLDAMETVSHKKMPETVNINVDDTVERQDLSPNLVENLKVPVAVLTQPDVHGTLKELQEGLDPTIIISRRRRPIKKHVRQMINNVKHGAIILREPDRNVAARNLIHASIGKAVVQQADYICIGDLSNTKEGYISPSMKKFVLSIMAEANDYDKQ